MWSECHARDESWIEIEDFMTLNHLQLLVCNDFSGILDKKRILQLGWVQICELLKKTALICFTTPQKNKTKDKLL